MATRWMRWNEGTHIFEYATDGVTFNPLPLNAATITEGVLNSARLPANVALTDAANIFTAPSPISIHYTPARIKFSVPSGGTDLKNWQIAVSSSAFTLNAVNDADTAVLAVPMTINRSGKATFLDSVDIGTVSYQTNGLIRVCTPGTIQNCIEWGNTNPAGYACSLGSEYQGFPFVGFCAVGGTNNNTFKTTGQPGFIIRYNISASRIEFSNVGSASADNQSPTLRACIDINGNFSTTGGYYERGRSYQLGTWIDIPYSAGAYIAWTVEAADQVLLNYTVIGKTCIVNFNITNATIATPQPYVYAPLAIAPAHNCIGTCFITVGATTYVGYTFQANLAPQLVFRITSGNIPAGTNNVTIQGQFIYDIA